MSIKIYKITIITKTPFNISSGNQENGIAKSISIKDVNGKPYISGSTMKGKIREHYRMITDEERTKELFGDGGYKPSKIIVDNFYLSNNEYSISIRYGNAIDRYRKVTLDGALYSKEVVSGTFVGEIEVNYGSDESIIADLELAIKMISSIGGSTSSGLGKIEIYIEEVVE